MGEWSRRPGITWLGHIEDILSLWRSCHFAVLPSHREGLPVSLLEAAAYGRPMIATDAPGCREIVIEDQTGLLVPIEDPAALAQAILKLATSPELRARYGKAARQLVVSKLSAKIIYQGPLAAPVAEGLEAGRLRIWRGQSQVLDVPLRTGGSVATGTLTQRALDAGLELAGGFLRKTFAKNGP